jgi:hypothetical protein
VTRTPQNLAVEFSDEPRSGHSETSTVTEALPEDVVQMAIARVVLKSDRDLAEDLMIGVQVRERIAEDTGERLTLTSLIEAQGFDPADFGV